MGVPAAGAPSLFMKTSCEKFLYHSPNGIIEGFRCRNGTGRQRPIIFCRGGNRDFGAIDSFAIDTLLAPLAEAGFAVYATQYSGGPNSEGKDEYGGKDVADVLALLDVLKADGAYTEGGFLGILGFSRGAVDACRAMQQGLPVSQAAFVGGLFDMRDVAKARPDLASMLERDGLFEVNEKNLQDRSALTFAESLSNIPFLFLHSEEDDRVNVRQSKEMAEALGSSAIVKIFPGNDHGLLKVANERNALLIDWFSR